MVEHMLNERGIMNSREKQKQQRREQILDVALDMFICKGFHGTSTREISKKAGISSGLMFHYFDSKEALYLALLKKAVSGVNMVEQLGSLPMSPLQVFEKIAAFTLESFAAHPSSVKMFILVKQAMVGDYLNEEMRAVFHNMNLIERMVPLIEAGQMQDEIRDGNALSLALCFFSGLQGVAEMLACYPHLPMPSAKWIVACLKKD